MGKPSAFGDQKWSIVCNGKERVFSLQLVHMVFVLDSTALENGKILPQILQEANQCGQTDQLISSQ